MRTFEERFTAWVDGQLKGDELVTFEQELLGHENAMSERANAIKLGALLRKHGVAPALRNRDFFNHSLMQRIYSELPTVAVAPGVTVRQKTWWGLPRILWAGAACLVAAMIILPIIAPTTLEQRSAERDFQIALRAESSAPGEFNESNNYEVEVLKATSGDPAVSAVAVNSADKTITVVWLDGLDYIPASNQITASNSAN